jgi:hypothetical protein
MDSATIVVAVVPRVALYIVVGFHFTEGVDLGDCTVRRAIRSPCLLPVGCNYLIEHQKLIWLLVLGATLAKESFSSSSIFVLPCLIVIELTPREDFSSW